MIPVEIVLVIDGLTFQRSYDEGYCTDDINNDVAATVAFMNSQERLFIKGEVAGDEKKRAETR